MINWQLRQRTHQTCWWMKLMRPKTLSRGSDKVIHLLLLVPTTMVRSSRKRGSWPRTGEPALAFHLAARKPEIVRGLASWSLSDPCLPGMILAHAALSRSSYPKLLFVGDPDVLVAPAFAKQFTKGLRNCSVVHLDPGAHYLQEDHPQTISAHIKQWLIDLGVSNQTTV